MAPQIIFGTAGFGMDMTNSQDPDSIKTLLTSLQSIGISRLDTGARYPPMNPGRSEELIGLSKEVSGEFVVDTKVYTNTQTNGGGDLSTEAMEKSVNGSLERLQRPKGVNVLYAHRADPETPLEEQIQNFTVQVRQGHAKYWGVSNTPVDVLEKILSLCEQNNWPRPSCYQGAYNALTRGAEAKLFPLLRAHGMPFNAYQPLAAGLLTGKLVNGQQAGTRFDDKNPLGKAWLGMFGAPEVLEAVKEFDRAVKALGLTPTEVALRWLAHHSVLKDEDGIIIGASRESQAVESVDIIKKGPLNEDVLPIVETLWSKVAEKRGVIL